VNAVTSLAMLNDFMESPVCRSLPRLRIRARRQDARWTLL